MIRIDASNEEHNDVFIEGPYSLDVRVRTDYLATDPNGYEGRGKVEIDIGNETLTWEVTISPRGTEIERVR